MKTKRKNIVRIGALLIVLSIFPLFGLQAGPIAFRRSITWVPAGDKWDPSQMALVRTEFDEEISYGSKEYTGPQTVQALMDTFDETYNRKHSRTVVTIFSKASIAEIKPNETTEIDTWRELLSKEGISHSFKEVEIDARYPRTTWLQLLLEKGITIESLIDYFFSMAHRHQLAFLEDSRHLWKTEIHGTSAINAWETYKADYIERFVRYYTENWKPPAEATAKRIEIVESSIPKVPNVPTIPQAPQLHSELEKMNVLPLQSLVNQLEQTVEDLERQNRWDAAQRVKEALEHVKKALKQTKTSKPSSNEPKQQMKRTSRYPPL